MGSIPVLKPGEVITILLQVGFVEVRQRGSHKQFRNAAGKVTTVPYHLGSANVVKQEAIASAVQRLVSAAHSPIKVILFGSYAKGTADEQSDLDLLVVEDEIPSMADEYNRLRGAIGAIGAGVDVLLYPWEEFERRANWQKSPVYDAVRTGKVLYERIT